MGYELELYIGQEWNFDSTCGGKFPHTIHHIAKVDISNPGYNSKIFAVVQKYQKAKKEELGAIKTKAGKARARTEIYSGVLRGNSEVNFTEDKYGDPLVAIPLAEIREALQEDWEASKSDYTGWDLGYRRFYIALALINAIIETFPEKNAVFNKDGSLPNADRLVAIPWGH